MNRTTNLYKNKGLNLLSALFIGFIALTGIQGCSSSSSSTPVALPDQDASGLFKSGTAELNSGATMLNDLRAFVYQGRIMMFSVNGHILYDGQITSITSDDYTATVDVYEVGVKTQTAISVTGKVTSQSQITGTIAGTGSYSGTFTLTYDMAYETASSIAKITDQPLDWVGKLLSVDSSLGDTLNDIIDVFSGTASTSLIGVDAVKDIDLGCSLLGSITVPDSGVNIYSTSLNVPSSIPFNSRCTSLTLDSSILFTGFISVLSESGIDKEALFAVTDGTNSVFGLLVQQ